MAQLGITLPNRPFMPGEWERIKALGCRQYVDLHWYAYRWQMIKESQPEARIHARIDTRGPLGNPAEEARDTANKIVRYGAYVDTWRRRNEVNIESPGVTPEQWKRWLLGYFAALDALMPGGSRKHNVPAASPGIPGWDAYVIIIGGHQNDAHGYGNQQEVEAVLALFPKGSLITEWNFGAGRQYSIEQWVTDLADVLSSSTVGLADALIVFSWDWANADMRLPTPVNVVGTAMESAIKAWNGGVKVYRESTSPCHSGPRTVTNGVIIHATGAKTHDALREYNATINVSFDLAAEQSCHVVFGPNGEIFRCVAADNKAWHAVEHNNTHLGLELARGYPGDPFPAVQLNATARYVAAWCVAYNIPIRHSTIKGIAEHREMPQGKRAGKIDVGPPFDIDAFVQMVKREAREWAPAPVIDWQDVAVYSQWSAARIANHEDPRDRQAFVTHLQALGCDANSPYRYGFPLR